MGVIVILNGLQIGRLNRKAVVKPQSRFLKVALGIRVESGKAAVLIVGAEVEGVKVNALCNQSFELCCRRASRRV